ncbi:MAG: peroxidase family protein [Vicinamibacterales bacterium]
MVLQTLAGIQQAFNDERAAGNRVSLADLIVLGGCAAVEKAAKDGGVDVRVPFAPGRTDTTQAQTDVESFAVLEPVADGFRNYLKAGHGVPAEVQLVEKAQLLTLTAPELTVLVGGLRVLGAGASGSVSSPRVPARCRTTSSCTCSTWAQVDADVRGGRGPSRAAPVAPAW